MSETKFEKRQRILRSERKHGRVPLRHRAKARLRKLRRPRGAV